MSYVEFVIRAADFPSVDYDSKKKTKKAFGTPIDKLPLDLQKELK